MRALDVGDGLRVRAAAHELHQVSLGDALKICLVLRNSEPERVGRFSDVRSLLDPGPERSDWCVHCASWQL
jgi:hypothetical protein